MKAACGSASWRFFAWLGGARPYSTLHRLIQHMILMIASNLFNHSHYGVVGNGIHGKCESSPSVWLLMSTILCSAVAIAAYWPNLQVSPEMFYCRNFLTDLAVAAKVACPKLLRLSRCRR